MQAFVREQYEALLRNLDVGTTEQGRRRLQKISDRFLSTPARFLAHKPEEELGAIVAKEKKELYGGEEMTHEEVVDALRSHIPSVVEKERAENAKMTPEDLAKQFIERSRATAMHAFADLNMGKTAPSATQDTYAQLLGQRKGILDAREGSDCKSVKDPNHNFMVCLRFHRAWPLVAAHGGILPLRFFETESQARDYVYIIKKRERAFFASHADADELYTPVAKHLQIVGIGPGVSVLLGISPSLTEEEIDAKVEANLENWFEYQQIQLEAQRIQRAKAKGKDIRCEEDEEELQRRRTLSENKIRAYEKRERTNARVRKLRERQVRKKTARAMRIQSRVQAKIRAKMERKEESTEEEEEEEGKETVKIETKSDKVAGAEELAREEDAEDVEDAKVKEELDEEEANILAKTGVTSSTKRFRMAPIDWGMAEHTIYLASIIHDVTDAETWGERAGCEPIVMFYGAFASAKDAMDYATWNLHADITDNYPIDRFNFKMPLIPEMVDRTAGEAMTAKEEDSQMLRMMYNDDDYVRAYKDACGDKPVPYTEVTDEDSTKIDDIIPDADALLAGTTKETPSVEEETPAAPKQKSAEELLREEVLAHMFLPGGDSGSPFL